MDIINKANSTFNKIERFLPLLKLLIIGFGMYLIFKGFKN